MTKSTDTWGSIPRQSATPTSESWTPDPDSGRLSFLDVHLLAVTPVSGESTLGVGVLVVGNGRKLGVQESNQFLILMSATEYGH